MVTVEQAEKLVLSTAKDYGHEYVPFNEAVGRVLAEDIKADRDLPPYNRVAMDGIAISYEAFEKGLRKFRIAAIQAAGETPRELTAPDHCIEIMTGAAMPASADTVIRYEDLKLENGFAVLQTEDVVSGQSVHPKGSDKRQHEIVIRRHEYISPAVISVIASVGKTELAVKKLPSTLIISTGNELVDVHETPSDFEIRRSNNYTIKAVLETHGVKADLQHLADDEEATTDIIRSMLDRYDVMILSGGISMGKFDYVPKALEACGVQPLFYKVAQRPGKPFWFGRHENGTVVFAFPGNPVSTFMCLHRYLLPWLDACVGFNARPVYAVLDEDVQFKPPLKYFLQVKLFSCEDGKLKATAVAGNGSGDFANLTATDAFMELPADRELFRKGEAYTIWKF
jgi:molybdopterin molybdotransferase